MASNFSAEREKAKAEGLTFFYCDKPCKRGHVAKRYVSSGNCHECRLTEEFRARRRELRPKYKEHLQEKDKVRKAQWSQAHRERLSAKALQWYYSNKEQHIASVRRWRRSNKAAAAAIRHKRRSLETQAGGSHSAGDIKIILLAQKGKCAYCRKRTERKYHVDHIIPLSRGGSNAPSNLQITCPSCNMKKAAMMPLEFAKRLGMLV